MLNDSNVIENVRLSFVCDKQYEAMSPCNTGRHCAACNKVVIDFTNKTAEDLQAALANDTAICGRFTSAQLAPAPTATPWFKRFAASLFLLIGLGAFSKELSAQTEVPKIDSISAKQEKQDYLGVVCMKLPEYIDGEVGLKKFIIKNLRYPTGTCAEGTVLVAYSVTPEGKVFDIEVRRGWDDAFNQEAMRVVGLLQYKPFDHTVSTKPVKMMLPIRFARY